MPNRLGAVFGDFRQETPPEKAALVLTDPPYNLGHDYGLVSDRLDSQTYLEMLEDLAKWAHGNTLKDAHFFIVHQPKFFFEHGQRIFIDQARAFGYPWDYRQKIAWCYPSNIGHSKSKWTSSHREILWLTKGEPFFDPKGDPEPYMNPGDKRVLSLMMKGSPGRAPYDWWFIDLQKNVGKDYTGYSNQLPVPLLERIILSATHPNELVADPFAGSGSTLKAALSLGRKAWGCDLNPNAPALSPLIPLLRKEPEDQ